MDLTLRGPGSGIESSANSKIRSLTQEVERLAALVKSLVKNLKSVDENNK